MIKCRNFLCYHHDRGEKNGRNALIGLFMCSKRKAFERIMRAAHGNGGWEGFFAARGYKLTEEMQEDRKK